MAFKPCFKWPHKTVTFRRLSQILNIATIFSQIAQLICQQIHSSISSVLILAASRPIFMSVKREEILF